MYHTVTHDAVSASVCRIGLSLLFLLHAYWYFLFGKILIAIIKDGPSHDAGRAYEGDSGDEDEDDKKHN